MPNKTLLYVGPQENWGEDAHVEQVRYTDIYPGINLVLVTHAGRLEYNFEVAPYADAKKIRIRYGGAKLSIAPDGDLEIHAPGGTISQQRPRAFQKLARDERAITCRYRVLRRDEVTLDLGSYDRRAPVFIDPVLVFSTYAGGSGYDAIYGIALDSSSNVYLTGETSSEGLWNGLLPARSNHVAFVTKLNSTATRVFYTVYVGGSSSDSGRGIALDASGNTYITGVTDSTDFPTTSGAYSKAASVFPNAFVAKLNPNGQLLYSTYLGNTGPDSGLAIAINSSGAAYITGQTESTSFPVTTGAFQTAFQGGASDCFVSELNATGSALIYSTFLGGTGLDLCSGIAVDSAGEAYLTGTTYSSNFPVQSAYQSSLFGTASAFVTKVNPTGTGLLYSTYLGGSGIDHGNAIALDSSGNAYITGATDSFDFPVTAGAPQTALNGIYNTFVSKLSTSGTLIYSTFLGGSATDTGASIAVDPAGRAVLGGSTSSSNFPTVGAIQPTNEGGVDAFASVLDPFGATLLFSTYFGGAGNDQGYAIGVSPGDNVYLAGLTDSSNFPTVAAIQPALDVPNNGFLLEVSGITGGATSFLTGYALNNPALRNNFTGWVGMQIEMGASPVTVASLGRICVAGNSGTHTVQIVNATGGTVVGSAQVNMAGCTPGQFAYTSLSPTITLQANTTYYLASQEFTGGDQWYNDGAVSSTTVATVSNGIYSNDDSSWIASGTLNTSYVPPNFTYLSSGAGTITVNVQASPSGATFSVDGVSYSAPQAFQWTPGSSHTLATVSPQSGGTGTQYVWSSWNDGGALSHTVSPGSNISYTASFTTQYLLTTSISPAAGGTIAANPTSATGYYNSGTTVQLTAAANSGYTFLNWSGALSGSTPEQTLTMSAPQSVTANFQSNNSGGATSFLTGYALNNPALRNDFTGWVGMQIKIGASPVTVASLGRICVAGNSGTHAVQIVNPTSGTAVASAQVNMPGCTPGQFTYTALSPTITLQANTIYFVASQEVSGGDQWFNVGTVSTTSVAAVSNGIFSYNDAAWNAAPAGLSNASYVPPNFTYLSNP